MKKPLRLIAGAAAAVMLCGMVPLASFAEGYTGWRSVNGKDYWYENDVLQGLEGRGKEIYDPASGAWYWLDAVQGGAKAVSKDVYQESDGGKWVRYDANGHMVKGEVYSNGGWYYFDPVTGAMTKGWLTVNGKTYYYDPSTGIMVHGSVTIDGKPCVFDNATGVGLNAQWLTINGKSYWYENGVRQGTEGRGKEIYDPASKAWYWLDAVQGGAKAVSKDVYQESNGGKWVRYDADGHMVKGWSTNANGTYYFDPTTGAMAKGPVTIDGKYYAFDTNTGLPVNAQWITIGGKDYWYEKGLRQGTDGRGKEIYDPASKAWYWLDAANAGAKAVSKDVYQDSNGGKWVRYDENGHMIKGADYRYGGWYMFDTTTGAMIKGWYNAGGKTYYYDTVTGKRVIGDVIVNNVGYHFDSVTGVLRGSRAVDVKAVTANAASTVTKTVASEHDAFGNILVSREYNSANVVIGYHEYLYDTMGRQVKDQYTRSAANGDFVSATTTTSDYNAGGQLTKVTVSSSSGSSTATTYTYDESGNLTKESVYNNGTLTSYTENTYVSGRKTTANTYLSRNSSSSGDFVLMTTNNYVYDAAGKLYQDISYTNGVEISRITYTYNRSGLLESVSTYANSTLQSASRYEYDSSGACTKESRYGSGGAYTGATTYATVIGKNNTAVETITVLDSNNLVLTVTKIDQVIM